VSSQNGTGGDDELKLRKFARQPHGRVPAQLLLRDRQRADSVLTPWCGNPRGLDTVESDSVYRANGDTLFVIIVSHASMSSCNGAKQQNSSYFTCSPWEMLVFSPYQALANATMWAAARR
jgi:hypothetical protein